MSGVKHPILYIHSMHIVFPTAHMTLVPTWLYVARDTAALTTRLHEESRFSSALVRPGTHPTVGGLDPRCSSANGSCLSGCFADPDNLVAEKTVG